MPLLEFWCLDPYLLLIGPIGYEVDPLIIVQCIDAILALKKSNIERCETCEENVIHVGSKIN